MDKIMNRRQFIYTVGGGLVATSIPELLISPIKSYASTIPHKKNEKQKFVYQTPQLPVWSYNLLVPITITRESKNIDHVPDLYEQITQGLLDEHNVFVFYPTIDALVLSTKEKLKDVKADTADIIIQAEMPITENFMVDEMDLSIHIDKSDYSIDVFQHYEEKDLHLLHSGVAIGGIHKDHSRGIRRRFSTPTGQFYLKRISSDPYWYPPSWAKTKKRIWEPGPKNPYGKWMAELYRNADPGKYDFYLRGDSKIRIHSTDKPWSIGKSASHGCIRTHPEFADVLFPFILHYKKHHEPKKNGRGTVHPLITPIPLEVKL